MSDSPFPRLLLPRLQEALDDTPVVLIHGPRQCGKTTLARMIGKERGYVYISFDDTNRLEAAKNDPVGFVDRLDDKVILDEVQHVPELFSAIKLAVDRNRKPGRFLLTGSANVLLLPKLADSLAGRMEITNLRPLARCEIERSGDGLLERLLRDDFSLPSEGKLGEKLSHLIIESGFPEPLRRGSERRKNQWFLNYIETLVQRDIRDLSRISRLDTVPKILELAAVQSAQLLNMSQIAAPFQISRQTVASYFTLLQNIFLVDILPAWHSNRLKRLVKTPKVHMGDTGLAAALMGVSADELESNRKLLGQLLENFVYNELRRQATWAPADLRFFHFRDNDQHEVDIIIQQRGGGLMGVEVKAAATVTAKDFRGLKRMQSALGDEWKMGIVFYDGDVTLSFGSKMLAVPISALWG